MREPDLTRRREDWLLQLITGETATVSARGGMLRGISCTIGELSDAVAPRLAPQRYFTLTLSDVVLHHPTRDALITALVWISESSIASLIQDAGGAD